MTIRSSSKFNTLVVCFAVLVLVMLQYPVLCYGDHVKISPHRIVLNAKGQSDDIQAIVGNIVPRAGHIIRECTATLYLNDERVTDNESFHYCAVDDNLLIGFDREAVQESPVTVELAGQAVEAKVEGSFTAYNAVSGDSYTQDFMGTDMVEILNPGREGAIGSRELDGGDCLCDSVLATTSAAVNPRGSLLTVWGKLKGL